MRVLLALLSVLPSAFALVPLLDGGKSIPALYKGWMNEQIVKQASTGISNALAAGYDKIEVQFPPVPNVDEVSAALFRIPSIEFIYLISSLPFCLFSIQVKFGTPLNKQFGTNVVGKDLKVPGGYKPGSNLSRELVAFSNIYWAKKLAPAVKGGILGGKSVACLTTEPVSFSEIKNTGDISRTGAVMSPQARQGGRNNEAVICVNPGGEERWDSLVSAHTQPGQPFVVLNNAYSTSYGLGNMRGYEEAYYLKRISKGWIFRIFRKSR